MGDVWLAHNETLDTEVAVKLLRKEADSPEAGSRFLREARAAARLGHAAIVRIFDFGLAEGGEPFIVMERLVGEDLATALQCRGRLPAIHAVRTLLPVVHALSAAHAKGIVHRDLKPENVFLSQGEGDRLEPKVVDFGVAKLDLPTELALTKDGMLLGSPAYMSPEQAQGMSVDHRADIWSLAVVLYEMVAGVRPFVGRTHNAILLAIGREQPRPFTELSAGDDALWRIVSKALRKNPAERWDSMQAFGDALAAWALACGATEDISGQVIGSVWSCSSVVSAAPPGNSAPPPPAAAPRETVDTLPRGSSRSKRWRLLVIAGLALAVLAGALLWAGRAPSAVTAPASKGSPRRAVTTRAGNLPVHTGTGSSAAAPSARATTRKSKRPKHRRVNARASSPGTPGTKAKPSSP